MKFLPALLLALLTALRLWLAAVLTVTPLEAYYWLCGHRLDWAFFDGPAGCAWLVHLGGFIGDGPLGLRLFSPLFAALASFAAFLLGRSLFGSAAGIWAAVALNALPFFNIAAVHAGPALPALSLVLLAAWAFLRALDDGMLWWTCAGLLLLLAEQFQYSAILLVPGMGAACAISFRHRAEWGRPGLYVALWLALTGFLPLLVWNLAHDWPSLALGTWTTALTPQWERIGAGLWTMIILFSLPALVAMAAAKWPIFRAARLHTRPRLAMCLAVFFAVLWLYQLLHGEAGNFALLAALALFASAVTHFFLESARLRVAGSVALLLTAACSALTPFGSDPWTQSTRGVAWDKVAASLDALLAKAQPAGAPPLLLIAQDPDATAALNYHLARTTHPEVFLRESQDVSNQFALWPRYDDFVRTEKPPDDFFKLEGSSANPYLGRSALYLTDEEPADLPQTITAAFARKPTAPFAILELSGGRKLRVYLCEDYQTMPL